jgi:hypothetical protein
VVVVALLLLVELLAQVAPVAVEMEQQMTQQAEAEQQIPEEEEAEVVFNRLEQQVA